MTSSSFIEYALTPSQADAVASAALGGCVVVRGPAGSGKTRVMEAIVRNVLEDGGKALIVAPLYGLQAFERRLADVNDQWNVDWINARTVSASDAVVSVPDAPAVALILSPLLRSAAVREAALRFGADVIVADDLDMIASPAVKQLMDLSRAQPRVPLVLTEEGAVADSWAPDPRVIDLESFSETDAERRVLRFARRSDEVALIEQIRDAVTELPDLGGIASAANSALLSLDSSWAAVERALLRLRRRLERSTRQGVLEAWDLGDEIDVPEPFELLSGEERIEEILADVDSLAADSKVEALVASGLWPGGGGATRLCLVTSSRATAEYLAEVFAGHGSVLYLPDPRAVDDDGELEAFRRNGGVCVITDQAVQTFDLGPVDVIVHYDLPASWRRLRRRSARLTPLGAGGARVEAVMDGEPSTWPSKFRAMLRDAGFIPEDGSWS